MQLSLKAYVLLLDERAGAGYYGQLGTGSTWRSNVPVAVASTLSWAQVAVGTTHTCAVASTNGSMWCWGGWGAGARSNSMSPLVTCGGDWGAGPLLMYFLAR